MRRFVDALIAAVLVAVPVLAITTSAAAAPTVAATSSHAHYVASACAPEDPGTL
jgi:hypothetical protein